MIVIGGSGSKGTYRNEKILYFVCEKPGGRKKNLGLEADAYRLA